MTAHDTICSVYGLTPPSVGKPKNLQEVEVLIDGKIFLGTYVETPKSIWLLDEKIDANGPIIGWRPARRAAA